MGTRRHRVDDVALLLTGATAGALATGVRQSPVAWRQRQLDRMVWQPLPRR